RLNQRGCFVKQGGRFRAFTLFIEQQRQLGQRPRAFFLALNLWRQVTQDIDLFTARSRSDFLTLEIIEDPGPFSLIAHLFVYEITERLSLVTGQGNQCSLVIQVLTISLVRGQSGANEFFLPALANERVVKILIALVFVQRLTEGGQFSIERF